MENSSTQRLTKDAEILAAQNRYNKNYLNGPEGNLNMEAVNKDFQLLQAYIKGYQDRQRTTKPSIGDCLMLPDGQVVYFCHLYDDRAQTCESGSFNLSSSGYLSYSGCLDSGICLDGIELTGGKWVLPVWFSHRGYLCAGSAIHANIECRVWRTGPGANLSGIPQVKRLKKKLLKAQSETITQTDGNGRRYTEHLHEVMIKKKNLSAELFQTIQQGTGLIFEDDMYYVPVYWCQPMTIAQLVKLKSFKQFRISEARNPITHNPILVLEVKS